MSRKQLITLFVGNLVPFTIGGGILPLLPVYLTRLGADPAQTGDFLAFAFFTLFTGTMVAGWLSDRFQRRKTQLILAGVALVPAVWLMGQASSLGQLMVWVAIVWFIGGVGVTTISILTGLFADERERGRIFGIIGSAVALGSVIGGLTSGPIVDRWGFQALFALTALFSIILPLSGLFLSDKVVARSQHQATSSAARGVLTSKVFLLLFFASNIAFIANSALILAKPLIMDQLRFDATAISGTAMVGGLISLPLPFLTGWLSDRFGRKPFLIFLYLTTMVGLIVMPFALQLWLFWVATALQIAISASIAVGSALVTDLVPQETLGVALAWFGATNWIGFVVGFAGTGNAIKAFGMTTTLILGVLLCVLAIVLLIPIHQPSSMVQVDGG
jgi:MFS family permease